MLTGDRGTDLKGLAEYLGIDLDTPLRDGRLQLIRYRPEFAARFAHSPSPDRVLADLKSMIGGDTPIARIAVDPLDPFLGEGGPVTAGALALVNFLEELGATALLTYSADPADNLDRRLDPIISRSVAIVRLERGHGNVHYLGVVRARVPDVPTTPLAFQIRRGVGIERYQAPRVALAPAPDVTRETTRRDTNGVEGVDGPAHSTRKLLVLHDTRRASDEIVALLRRDYETVVRRAPATGGALDLASTEIDAIVVAASHDSVDTAISLITRLNEQPDIVPIILAARFNLRSIDRAHALRAGADEILATDMSPPEFLQRLAAAVNRPHATTAGHNYSDTLILQPESGGTHTPLEREEFAGALASHAANDNPTQYTVVTLAPNPLRENGLSPSESLGQLADLVMRSNRVRTGDLTAVIDNRIAVYLHGARKDHASAFLERVRTQWTAHHKGSLKVESFPYPSGEPKLRAILNPSDELESRSIDSSSVDLEAQTIMEVAQQ
jgi:DNA-binding response OmpR family regulator